MVLNIWLVSIFEQTPVDNAKSTRFLEIADAAVKNGHKITFVASTFKHNTKNQRYGETTALQQEENYDLLFIKSLAYQKNISLKRLYSHFAFSKTAMVSLKKLQKPDIILIAFPPISLVYQVTKWAYESKIPVVMDIIDPWPDIFRKSMDKVPIPLQKVLIYPMSRNLKKSLQKVSAVTAISNQYLAWAKTYVPEIRKTACFYPAVDFQEMQNELQEILQDNPKPKNSFRVIYAGSLASSYDLPCIINAATILNKKFGDQIQFRIAGAGPQAHLVENAANQLNNFVYLGRLAKSDLMKEYAHADIGLIQHIKGATQSVTYKLFDLLACGLPIMNSLESEMKNIILDHEVGTFNVPGDAQTLANNIGAFYSDPILLQKTSKKALDLTKSHGDAKFVYKKMITMLEEITESFYSQKSTN